jgi:hypothetical protein
MVDVGFPSSPFSSLVAVFFSGKMGSL